MSISRHPIALRLEQRVGGATRLLATVMLLPLVDGIFAALVLSGALTQTTTVGSLVIPTGVLQIGLLVFGGSATVAVVLVDMQGSRREKAQSVLLVGVPLILGSVAVAALAPTVASLLDTGVFERFAAFVVLAIAAKTASTRIGDYLPSPGVIVALGLLASVRPSSFALVVDVDPTVVAGAAGAATVAVAFALGVALLEPHLRRLLDIDRFRFGSAVALGTLALSLFGIVPDGAALPVFALAGLLAIEPGQTDAVPAAATTDGGEEEPAEDGPAPYGYPGEDGADERAPWL
ncbi:hypothetical protein EFA46_007565 [Halarchaeum sp. CBA1220]|uniref:DUF5794 domain-containing protein n=1 Tax=Halarchaeum sp. CBA1220 TaxID=1853682 RepID=UPI000F3AA979|nr:DUF5794 domain-containing protein [Halarchaeum sp. CBA1220]QLC34067.1 hypothetical protein EFA46_007565 [Halarchaeum sp. CBA1220]